VTVEHERGRETCLQQWPTGGWGSRYLTGECLSLRGRGICAIGGALRLRPRGRIGSEQDLLAPEAGGELPKLPAAARKGHDRER
jgi:hypothetical protein